MRPFRRTLLDSFPIVPRADRSRKFWPFWAGFLDLLIKLLHTRQNTAIHDVNPKGAFALIENCDGELAVISLLTDDAIDAHFLVRAAC